MPFFFFPDDDDDDDDDIRFFVNPRRFFVHIILYIRAGRKNEVSKLTTLLEKYFVFTI